MFIYKPKIIGGLYLGAIPLFSLIYWLNPFFFGNQLSFAQSLYFSVITITTLGYGDITPITDPARLLTAAESLIGIILIGLFLNSVAHVKFESEQTKKREIVRSHLKAQYSQFRENIVSTLLRAEAGNYNIDGELSKKLVDIKEFRNHFNENNKKRWYDVLNGLEENKETREDLIVEIDLLVQQITYALNNVEVEDKKSLMLLTRFSQHTYRLKTSEVYQSDPVRYLSGFFWDVMAGWSWDKGFRDEDIVLNAIESV